MADQKDWYYQIENGRFPITRGPVSLEEMRSLVRGGTVQRDTLVRFGSDTRWHAAPNFLLLKRFLESAASDAESSRKKLSLFALTAAILALAVVYLLPRRETVRVYQVEPSTNLQAGPSAEAARLSVHGIIQYTNRARVENGGLPPLSENSLLDTIASERADDMFQKQYFAHISPSGEGATDLAQRTGYHYKHLGENIAMGYFQTDEKIVTAWMQSPGHRENIVSDGCSEIGVAVKKGRMRGEEVWVAVQIFGEQSPPVAAESSTQRSTIHASANSNSRPRKECELPDESLREAVTRANAELSDLTEQAASLRKEISTDRSSRASGIDARDLDQKVVTYNALVNTINDRRQSVLRLTSDYNRTVERYNACITN